MTYYELLKAIDNLNLSELDPVQLETLRTSMQIKISCINFRLRMGIEQKKINNSNSQEKCEE